MSDALRFVPWRIVIDRDGMQFVGTAADDLGIRSRSWVRPPAKRNKRHGYRRA